MQVILPAGHKWFPQNPTEALAPADPLFYQWYKAACQYAHDIGYWGLFPDTVTPIGATGGGGFRFHFVGEDVKFLPSLYRHLETNHFPVGGLISDGIHTTEPPTDILLNW